MFSIFGGLSVTNLREKANRLLDAYYKTTGIGALFFDTQLNLVAYNPQCDIADDFLCLGAHDLTSFLVEKFESAETLEEEAGKFYTYYFETNLVCNISFMRRDDRAVGALVTQPVLVNKMTQAELNQFLSVMGRTSEERRSLEGLFERIPFIPNGKVFPMGIMLSSLAETLVSDKRIKQEICGSVGRENPVFREFGLDLTEDRAYRHGVFSGRGSHEEYMFLKESVQSGDRSALKEFLSRNNVGAIDVPGDGGIGFVRSLKNYFIKVCAMSGAMAIEAGAPYSKTMEMVEQYINNVEKLTHANEIYDLMEELLLSFTRSVAVSRVTSYSKPVRQIMDYVETNFNQKITLSVLAEHTKLTPTYLSSLMKKETGQSLLDNINKTRVERSKKLLSDSALSNAEVAQHVGYNYQNHFSTIFKKYAGISPSEYRNSFKKAHNEDGKLSFSEGFVAAVIDKLYEVRMQVPGIYDTVRIVDPIRHCSRVLYPHVQNEGRDTCYSTSMQAYIHNRAYYKVESKDSSTDLVLALPIDMGNSTYIVEMIKHLDYGSAPEVDKYTLETDKLTGQHTRTYIEKNLPALMRMSRVEGRPLSVIVSTLCIALKSDNPVGVVKKYTVQDEIVAEFGTAISQEMCPGVWTGRYAGTIFVTVMQDSNLDAAYDMRRRIQSAVKKQMQKFATNEISVKVSCGVKTITDDIQNIAQLIDGAFLDLRNTSH